MPAQPAIHASCVAMDTPAGPAAALITGRAGAGKSRLALELISRGAALVADDRVTLTREGDALFAAAPAPIRGLIEARGVGLLRLPALDRARVVLAVDLDRAESERLPPARESLLNGVRIPLVLCGDDADKAAAMAPALAALLRAGGTRAAP
ncbi:HPr kinase/phosphorylase [Oceanicella actignis]|uniref:HPr kinase/phosphorylase n=1 Tax=Oceanicella actignis TaxID=1189325 RepID=A0A1M7TJB3_9RHOB|nr:HPr kinase/phosphatase C-terminal domain-containing protein [Oceanicella actignis]TYO88139.1 HPr kinase/phosphorylase [Oceanicella actignis]SET65766.1 Hpr(Ser) kinase/phosphatase [Oceanicella actignis]SHN70733.1 HPr kinase/phosphorylase [Oceanicella actignis]